MVKNITINSAELFPFKNHRIKAMYKQNENDCMFSEHHGFTDILFINQNITSNTHPILDGCQVLPSHWNWLKTNFSQKKQHPVEVNIHDFELYPIDQDELLMIIS